MFGFVQHGPVVSNPLRVAKQGRGGVSVGCFVRTSQGGFHGVDAVAPPDDSQGVLIFLTMENGNFLVVDLHDWSLRGNYGGQGSGSSGIAVAC